MTELPNAEPMLGFGDAPMINIRGQVVEKLGMMIMKGEVAPGQSLPSEAKLCEIYSVSRTVIREALRTLVTKGMLEARPKSGTKVLPQVRWNHLNADVLRWRLSTTETTAYLDKLFQLRAALDPSASALAARNASPASLARLNEAYDGMESAQTVEAYAKADVAFHQAIYFATENEFFWPIAQMFDLILRQSFLIGAKVTHRERSLDDHKRLLEAILVKDETRAYQATGVLLGRSVDDLEKTGLKHPKRTP